MSENVDVLNKSTGQTQSEIPFDRVPLPSKGVLYPEDHPLYNESHVDIKAMTAAEEDILSSRALLKKGTVVDTLIQSCLLNKSISPTGLLLGDKNAILLGIRIGGFGADYTAKTYCPNPDCNKSFNHTFDLSKVEIKELSVSPSIVGQNVFDFVLPKSGSKIQFKLLTSGDESDISKAQEAKKKIKKGGNFSEIETNVTDKLIYSIISYDGEKDKGKISTKVRKMPALDAKKLIDYINNISPDVKMVQEVTCPHCDNVEIHDIPMGIEFLWPKL